MVDAFAKLNGHPVSNALVHVKRVWEARVELMEAAADLVEGEKAMITVGELALHGTVDRANTFGERSTFHVVAGGGGWGRRLGSKAYHHDGKRVKDGEVINGIDERTVAEDAAREAGETIGSFPPSRGLGPHFVRRERQAWRVLEDVAGGVSWWVDYEGVTHVAERTEATPPDDAYDVLDFDPEEGLVILAVDDLRQVGIGSVLVDSARFDEPKRIKRFDVKVTPESVRVHAWTGDQSSDRGLAELFKGLVRATADDRLFGTWRYRVVNMDGHRVHLQAVSRKAGLPNILPVAMWPGVAGVWADLTPATEVLVAFIEGDPTMPIVTAFAPKGGPGFVPVGLTIGPDASKSPAARKDDQVQVTIPEGATVVNPETGKTDTAVTIDGKITEGSGVVDIG